MEISRRNFIRLGAASAFVFLLPSERTLGQTGYLSNLPKLPETLTKDIYYSAHVNDYGWTEWHTDGNTAGELDCKKPVNGIAIKVKSGYVSYKAYMLGSLWTDWYGNADPCGMMNEETPFGAIKITVLKGNVLYRVHFLETGWTSWVKNGKTCGVTGKDLTMNGIEIKIE